MMACAGRFIRHGDGIAFVFQGDRAPQRLRTDWKLLEVFIDDDVTGRRWRREFKRRGHDGIRQSAPCGVVVAQNARFRVVERNEANFRIGRARLEMEITMFGIDEQRILHDVAFTVARRLPFLQTLAVEGHRHRRVPIEIVMDIDVLVLNGLVEQRRIVVPIDDVVVEEETAVVFDAAADDLVVEAERQDVVVEVVIATVMLMDAAELHVVDEIESLLDFGAAFVGIEAPAACAIIIIGIDVVDVVVGDGRAVGTAERIDAAHVGEDALADIVDVVVVDMVTMGDGIAVAPCPAHGDACVEEVADIVVRQRVVAGMSDPDAVCAVVETATMGDDAVVDGDEIRHLRMVFRNGGCADFDASAAQIMDMAVRHGDAMAAQPPPEAHDADGTDFAVVE